jgi:hypothetical protein
MQSIIDRLETELESLKREYLKLRKYLVEKDPTIEQDLSNCRGTFEDSTACGKCNKCKSLAMAHAMTSCLEINMLEEKMERLKKQHQEKIKEIEQRNFLKAGQLSIGEYGFDVGLSFETLRSIEKGNHELFILKKGGEL